MTGHGYTYDQSYSNRGDSHNVHQSLNSLSISATDRTLSPPLSTPSSDSDSSLPAQLKAKVCFDNNYITLVIHSNIQFSSLTDRIDAKLSRFTRHSIKSGDVRLRYRDEDGDFVSIDSDEAVMEAFLDWKETRADRIAAGQVGEIMLYCQAANGQSIAS